MKDFHPNKVLRRHVRIKSSDPSIPAADWIVSLSGQGIHIRRARSSDAFRVSWRSVIGYALVHSAGFHKIKIETVTK